jgi:hypothetical protein
MRDIGTLIWVAVVILGIVSSMRSSMRRQRQASQAAPASPQPAQPSAGAPAQQRIVLTDADARQRLLEILQQQAQASGRPGPPPAMVQRVTSPTRPAPGGVVPPQPQPAPAPLPSAPTPAAQAPRRPEEPRRSREAAIFHTGPSIVRAIIAAEVLGKPRAFNDEYHW